MSKRRAARRGRKEGSIYQVKDGRWVGALNLGYQNGKLKRKVYYGKTREEAHDKLVAALADLKKGLPIVTTVQTVAEFLETWLTDIVKPSVRPKTYASYAYLVKQHLSPGLGRYPLLKLTPQHVQLFLNERRAGLSARTVNYLQGTLRSALKVAIRWGLIYRNVAELVTGQRQERHEILPLTLEQATGFLETVKGHRLEALFTVALAMGLRQGEALGLRWEDVDLESGLLRVNAALQWINKRHELVEPKTERSRRTLQMPAIVLGSLRAHRSHQNQERLSVGEFWQNDRGLVFTTSLGTPLGARNVVRSFHGLLKAARLTGDGTEKGRPLFRFHDLRHSCATLLLAQGVAARTVMEILGHSQISLTMNTYAHVMPETVKDAMGRMDAALTGTK
jgi:integrase